MLKKFDLTQCSTMKNSMAPPLTLHKDPNREPMNVTTYRGIDTERLARQIEEKRDRAVQKQARAVSLTSRTARTSDQ